MKDHDAILKANLEAMIPKSLDDVIRINREHAQVRHATETDLAPLLGKILPGNHIKVITNWHLVTIELLNQSCQGTLLLGDIDNAQGGTWITSNIVKYDQISGYVLTHSGSIYKLGKQAEGEPDFDQLVLLCVRMRQSGPVASFFGIPEYFY